MIGNTPKPSSQPQSHPQPQSRSVIPRYHPYSDTANPLAYRRGPPSIASSVTSYAPSIASDTTIIPIQHRRNVPQRQVNTSVAPSSHIWEEFYAEHGRPKEQSTVGARAEDDEVSGIQNVETTPRLNDLSLDLSITSTNNSSPANDITADAALNALLSTLFDQSQVQDQGSSSHQISNGDYPGAEFLNLPDTASTVAPNFPNIDGYDLSQFDYGLSQNTSANDSTNTIDPILISDREEVAANHSCEAAEGVYVHNSSDTKSPLDRSNRMAWLASIQSETHVFSSSTLPVPSQTIDILSTDSSHEVSRMSNNGDNKTKSNTSNTCTYTYPVDEIPFSLPSKGHSHLKNIKMKSLHQDREVIRFQKQVLETAATFYSELGQIFENTPKDTVKLGMTRTGMMVQDDTISVIIDDIKSLCGRLTSKATNMPGYSNDKEDTEMSGDNTDDTALLPSIPKANKMYFERGLQGSSAEPIDLTAPTPKSDGNTPASTATVQSTMTSSLGLIGTASPLIQVLPPVTHSASTLQSSPSTSRIGSIYNPYTPESLGAGPSSIMPIATPSPLCHSSVQQTQPFTSFSPLIRATTTDRSKPDLPPLGIPENRVVHGPWNSAEIERLRTLVSFSLDIEDTAPIGHIDWTWVVDNFGGTRNRHQILIKAVELGLKESSTHRSRLLKQKGYREAVAAMANELEAVAAMANELDAASSLPLRGYLPPLLPSAQICSKRSSSSEIVLERDPRRSTKPPPPESRRTATAVRTSSMESRRESSISLSSEPARTPLQQISPIPQDRSRLVIARSPNSNSPHNRASTSSLRALTFPHSPKSRIKSMGFKPYAHSSHPLIPNTAPPRTSFPRHERRPSGWRLADMSRGDGRPSIINPTFGTAVMAGYQLSSILDKSTED
ncbi:uncharacterized protein IL334_006583 [Kwoniella shivajii]|uniref:Uncharacterized protein n=1 Tax=Kwoniella shivajii TaxID=564305 RepID=A0ABZ1D6D2_9TREE|nr:hypothetical protein IL334_006583 [Kwoniella shivajii]